MVVLPRTSGSDTHACMDAIGGPRERVAKRPIGVDDVMRAFERRGITHARIEFEHGRRWQALPPDTHELSSGDGVSGPADQTERRFAALQRPGQAVRQLSPLPVIDQHVGNNDMTVVETKQVPESIDSDCSRRIGSGLSAHINRVGRNRPLALS